jgi:membrane protein YdbS with pleckstrin-like domain
MTFVNVQVPLDGLPAFDSVQFDRLHPMYPRVVFGLTLLVVLPALIFVTILLFFILVPKAGMPLIAALLLYTAIAVAMALLAWFSHKAASVIRYAIRQHDVIVHSGVYWKKETVQPLKRIQHVEQHQGPVDKRFGLYELKLFSAGTGHFTFAIPGLDAEAATRIKQFILTSQQANWDDVVGLAEEISNLTGQLADG